MDPFSIEDLSAHHQRVRRLVTSLVGDPDLGEDAVQGAWLKLFETKGTRRPRHLRAWLGVTARRVAWNERRGDMRRRDRERAEPQTEALPSSAEIAARAEISSRVLTALGSLEEPHQSLLRDHYFGGLGLQDLASRDDLPAETIRSRLRRARAAFRSRLESEGLGGDVHWSAVAAPVVFEVMPAAAPGMGAAATGWFVMKKLTGSLVLILAAALGVRAFLGASATDVPVAARHGAPGEESPLAVLDTAGTNPQAEALQAPTRDAGRQPAVEASSAAALHVVIGKVTDGDGQPLEGAKVSTTRFRGSVPVGHRAAQLRRGPGPEGVETQTAWDGSFTLELPFPVAEWTGICVSAGRHRRIEFRELRAAGGANTHKPVLHEDVGTIPLARASAVLGVVRELDGSPVEGARVRLNSKVGGSIGEDAITAADGSYVLGHSPRGMVRVSARAPGFYDGVVEGVTMELSEDTPRVDFILEVSPWISGVVVDQVGNPVADQRLRAAPATLGEFMVKTAKTGSDGRFRIGAVAKDVPHTLDVRGKGYELTETDRWGGVTVNPGDQDVRVVMRRLQHFQIQVVDDGTGQPIERFGLGVLKGEGRRATERLFAEQRAPRAEDHPGGEVSLAIRVGDDAVFVVAPGYRWFVERFRLDEESEDTRTLRLKKDSMITGRVLFGDGPAEGATVTLEVADRDYDARAVFTPDEDRRREVVSDSDGRFGIPSYGAGDVRLSATARDRGVLAQELTIPDGDYEVGDLTLGASGALVGRVLVPEGQSAEGLRLHLDDWNGQQRVLTGSGGRFRMEGVAPGPHQLLLWGVDPVLESVAGEVVHILAGETKVVLLDASSHGRAELALTVLLDGEPAAGVDIDLDPLGAKKAQRRFGAPFFGKTNEFGQVRGYFRTHQGVAVSIHSKVGRCFHPTVLLQPRLGEVQEHTISFETADAVLCLPEGLDLPRVGIVALQVLRSDRTLILHRRFASLRSKKMPELDPPDLSAAPGSLTLRGLLAGSVILRLSVTDLAFTGEKGVRSRDTTRAFEAEVTLRPGGGNVVTLKRVP